MTNAGSRKGEQTGVNLRKLEERIGDGYRVYGVKLVPNVRKSQ